MIYFTISVGFAVESEHFSLTFISFQILSGKQPFFQFPQDMSVVFQVLQGKRPRRSSYPKDSFADVMWELLVDCWAQDPAQRPNMAAVVQRLQNM